MPQPPNHMPRQQLGGYYLLTTSRLGTNSASKRAINRVMMRWDTELMGRIHIITILMKLHISVAPYFKVISSHQRTPSFPLLGSSHLIWHIMPGYLGNEDTTLQHIGRLICFSLGALCPKKLPPGSNTCMGTVCVAAPAAGGPLLPNEHGNLLLSQRRFSPDN
jgi:hypothetical protein